MSVAAGDGSMISGIFNSGALPVLERMVQFTSQRQKLLAHDVANLSTPYFKPEDVDPKGFQAALGEAIDRRRATVHPNTGPLKLEDTRALRFREGGMEMRPRAMNEGVLFHDQNNHDLERLMQDVAENAMAHNMAVELMRSEYSVIQSAIRERV